MATNGTGYAPALVARLLDEFAGRLARRGAPRLIGVSGLQGSGKSTLARQLVAAARAHGIDAITLSIDDFYLGRRARERLGHTVHPLLATRGVPGTHDTGLIAGTLAALGLAAANHPAHLPSFDKGRDTRVVPSRWHAVVKPPDWIVLEGWCIGIPPQGPAALRPPVNRLERRQDGDGYWRRYVNARLATDYTALWTRLDLFAVLQAPGFEVVREWRAEPERELRRRGAPEAMSPAALARFLMVYERLSRHALHVLPARADVVIAIDRHRRVLEVAGNRRAAIGDGAARRLRATPR
jgi:D-glycerate 3-kinase